MQYTAESTEGSIISTCFVKRIERLTCQSLGNLLVDDNVYLDTPIRRSSEHVV